MQQEPELNVIAKFMRCWFLMLILALLLLTEHMETSSKTKPLMTIIMVWYKQVYDDKRDKLWRPLPPTPTSRGCPGVLVMIRQILPTWHMASLKSTLKRVEMWDALRFIRSLQQERNRNRSKECFTTLDMFKAGIYWCTLSDSIYLYIYICIYIYIFNICIVYTLSYIS